jgi:hypothetical protein
MIKDDKCGQVIHVFLLTGTEVSAWEVGCLSFLWVHIIGFLSLPAL